MDACKCFSRFIGSKCKIDENLVLSMLSALSDILLLHITYNYFTRNLLCIKTNCDGDAAFNWFSIKANSTTACKMNRIINIVMHRENLTIDVINNFSTDIIS